jgi:hypothetical protein
MDIEKPAEDWEPITIVTDTVVCNTQPVVVLTDFQENEMITVTERVTETFTFNPKADPFKAPRNFEVDFTRSAGHLLKVWAVQITYAVIFSLLTLYAVKRKDIS